jgi:glyoxylase-like metal-dependent hydrolase (beta-lactamase superfamily II)
MKQIIPNVYYITGLPAGRVYVLKDPDGLTLIDASISGMAGKILAQIAAAGHTARDVKRILITHAHPDHVGSLPALKQSTGAQVICSAEDRPVVEGRMPVARRASGFRPPNTNIQGTPVDREVTDGDTIDALGGLQVVFTPGHSPGHLSFWQPQLGIAFIGDVLFHVFGVRLPPGFLTVDMEQDKRSVRKLANLKPQIVCFGHGDPIMQNTAQMLNDFANKIGV